MHVWYYYDGLHISLTTSRHLDHLLTPAECLDQNKAIRGVCLYKQIFICVQLKLFITLLKITLLILFNITFLYVHCGKVFETSYLPQNLLFRVFSITRIQIQRYWLRSWMCRGILGDEFNLQERLQLGTADHIIRDDFNAMNVVKPEKYMQKRGLSGNGYLKTSFVEIASAVEKMVLLVCPNFEKDDATTSDK